jgi:hypothetical protein
MYALDFNKPLIRKVSLTMDHTVPFVSLIIDYFFNAVPFAQRHFLIIGGVALIYVIFMWAYTKLDKPIYPIFKWESFLDYVVPFSIFIVSLIFFQILVLITNKKLKIFGVID